MAVFTFIKLSFLNKYCFIPHRGSQIKKFYHCRMIHHAICFLSVESIFQFETYERFQSHFYHKYYYRVKFGLQFLTYNLFWKNDEILKKLRKTKFSYKIPISVYRIYRVPTGATFLYHYLPTIILEVDLNCGC